MFFSVNLSKILQIYIYSMFIYIYDIATCSFYNSMIFYQNIYGTLMFMKLKKIWTDIPESIEINIELVCLINNLFLFNSVGFWRWCIGIWILDFLDFLHSQVFLGLKVPDYR